MIMMITDSELWLRASGLFNYWVVIFLMMTGFYIMIARKNLIKSVIGLNIFQTSVFLLYITMGKVNGGTAPILLAGDVSHPTEAHEPATHAGDHAVAAISDLAHSPVAEEVIYSNPLPSVLMLTAIVVGIATTALALALVVRIREEYGSIDERRIFELDRQS